MSIKVACVGAGYFSKFHIEAWQRIEDVELVAICDSDKSKLDAAADSFKVSKTYTDVSTMLNSEEIHVLDIITPPVTHLNLCDLAFDYGKHVICQKPMAPSFSEAAEMVDRAKEKGSRLIIHENFRFQPWYRQIKSIIQAEEIGDRIYNIHHTMRTGDGWGSGAYLDRQPYFREMTRLLIYETGIHFIDVFRYLIGDITNVYARLRRLNEEIKGEDAGLVLFDFEGGAQGVLDCNRYNEPLYAQPRYTFGEMTIDGNNGSLYLKSNGDILLHKLGEEARLIPYHHENKQFAGDCVFATQKAIIASLQSGDEFETEGGLYLKNLMVQEAIYQSSDVQQLVKIAP